jgi:hypothetical protein
LFGVLFFKLEEEESPALLLHLPKVFVESAVSASAVGMRRRLVVGFAQDSSGWNRHELFCGRIFRLENNGMVPSLIIFYQRALHKALFCVLNINRIACWLRRILQAQQTKNRFKSAEMQTINHTAT